MPDGFGGFMTPFLAAFDPDGRHTDNLTKDEDEHPEFHNGACLNHPNGCGLPPGADQTPKPRQGWGPGQGWSRTPTGW